MAVVDVKFVECCCRRNAGGYILYSVDWGEVINKITPGLLLAAAWALRW
jgi:hypothetical protein